MAEGQDKRMDYNNAASGLNMDQTVNQIKKSLVTYALNASLENYDANSINYQNEEGNEFCLEFPEGYRLIGKHFIPERYKHLFFLANPETEQSEIGYMDNNDCIYHTLINAPCLNFNINYPVHKVVHRITNCATEIYWTDGYNSRRYLDIDNIPEKLQPTSTLCDPQYTNEVDCNQLKLQPDLSIPRISLQKVISGGSLISGTYQFAVQYSDVSGNPYTSYYSITNPVPIANPQYVTPDFNYPVGKAIVIDIENLDGTGQFQYFNLAVIKTINNIASVELAGTYYIDNTSKTLTYSGQSSTDIRLSMADIFEKFPYYDVAQDVTAVQDVLVWDNLSSIDRVNYQKIANEISLQWETWRIPADEDYSDEYNAANLVGYTRDEIVPFEIVFLLSNGKQTDGFHIPGREKNAWELSVPDVPDTNNDFTGEPDYTSGGTGYKYYWKVYNTAKVTGVSTGYSAASSYKGAYQYGDFAYWESTDTYPCNEDVWGELSGKPIRHHKFPDVNVSPIFESPSYTAGSSISPSQENRAIYPIGVRIDVQEVKRLINQSSLTADQKADIIGFKIIRGDRTSHKSIVAKGILRNMGTYEREGNTYLYPNYPYNDLRTDPFLTTTNNAFDQLCDTYEVKITSFGGKTEAVVEYTSCETNKKVTQTYTELDTIYEICSTASPTILSPAEGTVGIATYEMWHVWNNGISGFHIKWVDPIEGEKTEWIGYLGSTDINIVPDTGGVVNDGGGGWGSGNNMVAEYVGLHEPSNKCGQTSDPTPITISDKYRHVFNSPETSFGNPFLGTTLKLESVIFGSGQAHFTEVKDNAKYKLLTKEAQERAILTANDLGKITDDFSVEAFFAAYEAQLTIYLNSASRKNFAYSFNSIANYNYSVPLPNDLGIKQRDISLSNYLIPGVMNVGDDYNVNNYQRESSVFIKTEKEIEYPNNLPQIGNGVVDNSRFTISEKGICGAPSKLQDMNVISYYASLKNEIANLWGQIYSYETVDTGFQSDFSESYATIFGGDTFISKFAFKTKLPFFIDNRVNAPDDSDIFYDEIGNIAYPKYWHSARSITSDYNIGDNGAYLLSNIISYKAHNFDCEGITGDTYDGYFYLFAYGVPSFYCETSYNLDLRQAFNNKEGDFFPHVSTGIPDDWVQESFVSIANDNTYYYNPTFSKQNKENFFSHLPIDWNKPCYTHYPFRAIYSDAQNIDSDNRINSWLIYRAVSYFDFPQNYGRLISLDGIQNKAILARFENKSLLYGGLLTIDTSNPQAAYIGNPNMFKASPPIDFADTDLGYVGSQHKFLLKIPQGQVTVDAKRGQVFLVAGTEINDLSAPGSGMNRFLTDHLSFEILDYFPNTNIDNHYNGIGLHGVYDAKYDRIIITKLDYVPLSQEINYDEETGTWYIEEEIEPQEPVIPTTTTTTTEQEDTTTSTSTTEIGGCILQLVWDDINNVPVRDASSVEDWNNFFDLPNYGGEFTSVSIEDNTVYLFGGVDITLKEYLFGDSDSGNNLLEIIDDCTVIACNDGVFSDYGLFEIGCFNLTKVHLPVCTSLGDYVFADCEALFDLLLPFDSYTTLGDSVFQGNISLTSCNWSNLTEAGFGCFQLCTELQNPSFPLLTTIGDQCFQQCYKLDDEDTFTTNFTTLGYQCFYGCEGFINPDFSNLITAGEGCFQQCTNMINPNFSALTSIGNLCFQGCEALNGDFSTLEVMGNQCFESCFALSAPNFENVTTIGNGCFVYCNNFTTMYFPSLVNLGTTVGDDSVFNDIFFQTITLTIPSILMTCNSGNPDGDIQVLNANNTLTIIQV